MSIGGELNNMEHAADRTPKRRTDSDIVVGKDLGCFVSTGKRNPFNFSFLCSWADSLLDRRPETVQNRFLWSRDPDDYGVELQGDAFVQAELPQYDTTCFCVVIPERLYTDVRALLRLAVGKKKMQSTCGVETPRSQDRGHQLPRPLDVIVH
nr:hypothetical protein CFP56_28500 [Quercus suber]